MHRTDGKSIFSEDSSHSKCKMGFRSDENNDLNLFRFGAEDVMLQLDTTYNLWFSFNI